MATVLVAVALLTTSIWIAIRMESGLGTPARPPLPADTDTVRPARCRFQPKAGYAGAHPVRCTQRSHQHMAQLPHTVPSGFGGGHDHDRGQIPLAASAVTSPGDQLRDSNQPALRPS